MERYLSGLWGWLPQLSSVPCYSRLLPFSSTKEQRGCAAAVGPACLPSAPARQLVQEHTWLVQNQSERFWNWPSSSCLFSQGFTFLPTLHQEFLLGFKMAFNKFVTRIIWPACSSCFSDLVSQEVLALSLLQSWSIITWFRSVRVGAFLYRQKSPAKDLQLDFWEWSTRDSQISVGICCPWECISSALPSFSSPYLLLAQLMCRPCTDETNCLFRLQPFRTCLSDLIFFWHFSNWLEWGTAFMIKPTCFHLLFKWETLCREKSSFWDIYCMEVLPGIKSFPFPLLPENFRGSIPMLWNLECCLNLTYG